MTMKMDEKKNKTSVSGAKQTKYTDNTSAYKQVMCNYVKNGFKTKYFYCLLKRR